MAINLTQGAYRISDARAELDLCAIHAYLTQSYWSPGIPMATVQRAIENSLCFGLYHEDQQIGFARVVSDFATFGYLCDVYVLEGHRGQGLSKWLMQCVMQHPDLQGLRRFMLATRDAHGLYRQFQFVAPGNPAIFMEIVKPNIYLQAQ
jgi:GNAT superfamily N-acetyltransferase